MLTITIYYSRGLWRVKRSDKELSTFTDPDFIPAYMIASTWSIQEGAMLVVVGKQNIGIGQIDFRRLDIGDTMYDEVDSKFDEDKDQLKLELEEVE